MGCNMLNLEIRKCRTYGAEFFLYSIPCAYAHG